MAQPPNLSELIDYVRENLKNRGEAGNALLGLIDASIARGVEKYETEDDRSSTNRRVPSDVETIGIIAQVLRAYLLDLPSAIRSVEENIRGRFGVSDIRIALGSELSSVDEPRTVADISLQNLHSQQPLMLAPEAFAKLSEQLSLLIPEDGQ